MPPKVLELSFLFVFSFFPGDRTKKIAGTRLGHARAPPADVLSQRPRIGWKTRQAIPPLDFSPKACVKPRLSFFMDDIILDYIRTNHTVNKHKDRLYIIRVLTEYLVRLGFLWSVSYIKSNPNPRKIILLCGKKWPKMPLLTQFLFGLGCGLGLGSSSVSE